MKVNRGRTWLLLSLLLLAFETGSASPNTRRSDSELLSLGKEKLQHAKVGDKVILRIEDAAATLEGSVESIGLKERAGREISKMDGISRVNNNLCVEFASGTDSKILDEAARQIRRYAFYTIFDNIDLAAADGRLTLSGQVTQPWRRQDLQEIVSFIPGVKEIENNLEVLPVSPFDNELRLRIARAIYSDPSLFRYGNQAYPPIHVVVKNGNVTLTGVVLNEVERVTAERAARFAATFFALDNELQVEAKVAKAKS
jgi:hyperosmotically inducible protein